jgi:hypothetical protein
LLWPAGAADNTATRLDSSAFPADETTVTLSDIDASEPVADESVRADRDRRAAPRPLWQHALALAVVLLALSPLLAGTGLFSGDEGAALAQAELLVEEHGWGFDVPRADLDPQGVVGPFDRADVVTGAPFAKHPAYPVLLVPFVALGGTAGAKLASLLGAVLASVAAALMGRRLRPGIERPVLWISGLASPLLFNGWVVIAHTLAAAGCGFAALLVLDVLTERPRWRHVVGVAALMLATVLLRNEAVLFGVALAAGAIGLAALRRSVALGWMGSGVLAGTVTGYLLDSFLTGLVASPEPPFVVGQTLGSSNYIAGRVFPTVQTMIMPVRGAVDGWDLLTVLALVLAVGAAVTLRRKPEDRAGITLMAVLAAAAGLIRLLGPPTAVPGLLTAFPLLPVGWVLLTRPRMRRPAMVLLGSTTVLFVGAVLATQYETGGTAEWGFRYAAAALPLMIPMAVVGLADAGRRLDTGLRVVLVGALVVLSGSMAALSFRVLDHQHRLGVDAVAVVEDVRAASDRPVVVTSYLPLGRMAWAEILSGEDWTLTDEDGEVEELAERLVEDGGDIVLVTQDADTEMEPFASTHDVVLRVPAVPSGQLEVLRLVRR